MSRLLLLCGKMASGKTTHSRVLAATRNAIRISEDEWLAGLFPGAVTDVASYVEASNRLKRTLRPHLVQLLDRKLSVVLDFPGNTRLQRAWLLDVARTAGVDHELHYIRCSDEECLRRLKRRAAEDPVHAATDTEAMFKAMAKHFEPPRAEEGLRVVETAGLPTSPGSGSTRT